MTAPEVSVVIPTHNRRRLLAATLGTVLAQRGVALEAVVVDDGSSDDTAEWLAAVADPRLTVVRHEQPTGVARARNDGIARASGRYLAFLDDDDLWAPHKLDHQLQALRRSGATWAVSGVVVVDDALQVLSAGPLGSAEKLAGDIGWHNSVPAGSSNVMARTDAVRQVGGFDTQLRHFADWDLWVKLARLGPPVAVPTADVAYRFHANNASSNSRDAIAECKVVGDRCADLRDGHPVDDLWVYRWIGWWSVLAGRRRDAVWAYLRAVRRGDVRSVGRLAVALAGPRLASGALHAPVNRELAAHAETWLQDLARPQARGT